MAFPAQRSSTDSRLAASGPPRVSKHDLLFESSCCFRQLLPPASRRCVRAVQLGPAPPTLAQYSLTESTLSPFHAEPTQFPTECQRGPLAFTYLNSFGT